MPSYTIKEIKALAPHLKTMGAYVQAPEPKIVGTSNTQIIGSQDAKSLYPTIMVLLNIGYDTLRGRIYESSIVKNIIEQLISIRKMLIDEPQHLESVVQQFEAAIGSISKKYANREEITGKKEFNKFVPDYYGESFRKLLSYQGDTNNIFKPIDDETYYLLKSCLYPLLEAYTWMSSKNKGYSTIIIDHVFYNSKFEEKYQSETFYIMKDINSSKTSLEIINYDEFKKITDNYILNSYGTYFDKHDTNKSFEVDLILSGMSDRSYVKNQFLIIDAITENWFKLSDKQKLYFILDNESLNEEQAVEIINLVGDPDDGVKKWQLKNLKTIIFDTIITEEKLKKKMILMSAQKTSRSNGIKVTLNSGYGIYGMATWNYGNNLIANSITSGGKIYGIKLFQQVASNRLHVENQKIESGFYDETFKP